MNDMDEIKYRFFRSVFKELEEDRTKEIHVTDLVYDCLRRAYYSKLYPAPVASEAEAMVLWIGKKLHETPVCKGHEYKLELELDDLKIVGSIDELCEIDGKYVIVDKKTTRYKVTKPYEHHVKQVQYYAALLKMLDGIDASKGMIMYMDVNNLTVTVFEFPLGVKEVVFNELLDKAIRLKKALEERKPPEPKPSWLCKYCPYWNMCVKGGEIDE